MNKAWLLAVILLLPSPAWGRPTIGLTLGGGGARGLSHVGVLLWLEEHRIPVDYVTGTSMGGLIGGLYSMGMTAAEVDSIVASINWNQVLSTSPSYDELVFRRKWTRHSYTSNLELGLRHGVSLPTAISDGHYVGMLLSDLCLPYSGLESFDSLPIPFRCVATDLASGDEVVLQSGRLNSALRATMSIPAVFAPVPMGDSLLVDGFLRNNVPVDVARDLGAEVVVAVEVAPTLRDRSSIRQLHEVLAQSMSIMGLEKSQDQAAKADIVIAPDLGQFSPQHFTASDTLRVLGYLAAQAAAEELRAYSLSEEEWRRHLDKRLSRRNHAPPPPERLRVSGVSSQLTKRVERSFRKDFHSTAAWERLRDTINELYGWGMFTNLSYTQDPASGTLELEVLERSYAPPFLNWGLDLLTKNLTESDISLGVQVMALGLANQSDQLTLDLLVGSKAKLSADYLFPIKGNLYAEIGGIGSQTNENLYTANLRSAVYRVRQLTGYAGLTWFPEIRHVELQTLVRLGYDWAEIRVGDPAVPDTSGRALSFAGNLFVDYLNSPVVPTRGFAFRGGYRLLEEAVETGHAPTHQIEGDFYAQIPVTSRHGINLRARGGTSLPRSGPLLDQFTLGGPWDMTTLDEQQIRGPQMLYGGVGWLFRLFEGGAFTGGRTYLFGLYETGGAGEHFDSIIGRHSASLSVITETAIGPIALAASVGDNSSAAFLTIGRGIIPRRSRF